MKNLALLASFTFLAACGGSDSTGAAAPEAPATPAATDVAPEAVTNTAMLASADMKVIIEGQEAMRISADGNIEANLGGAWTPVGTLKDDALWDKNGTKMISVDSTGAVTFADPGAPKLSFAGNALTFQDKAIAVGDDGVVTGLNPGAEGKIRIDGAVSDANKRAAVLLTVAMMMVSQQQQPAPAATTEQ